MLKQIIGVTATNLRSIPARWGASLVVVIGIAGVVCVMVSILAMAQGFEQVFTKAGRADRVIVMRGGDDNGMSSAISRDQLPLVLGAPGFARGADGKPLASPQKFMTSVLLDRKSGEEANVLLRGVGGAGVAGNQGDRRAVVLTRQARTDRGPYRAASVRGPGGGAAGRDVERSLDRGRRVRSARRGL
jgi:putative ABC transport system permease protein